MAGNAVPVPMGHFVLTSVVNRAPMTGMRTAFGITSSSGMLEDGMPWVVDHKQPPLATNLIDFVDTNSGDSLSAQAAAGLIVRSVRSGHPMPRELFHILSRLAEDRTGKLKASRGNSFEALDDLTVEVESYQRSLPVISEYHDDIEDEDFVPEIEDEVSDE